MSIVRKIGFVGFGSIDRHATIKRAFGMSPWLQRLGLDVSIVCEETPANREAALKAGIKIHTYKKAGIVKERRQKWQIIKREKFDLTHICGLGWRNDLKPNTSDYGLFVMDHVELESSLPGVSWMRRALQKYLELRSLSRYDGAVVASRYLETLFLGKQRGKLLYLPYGADPLPPLTGAETAELRKKYGLTRFCMYAGGLYKNYGIWTLIDATCSVLESCPDFQLVLVGRGPEESALRSRIAEKNLQGRIKILGYVSQGDLDRLMLSAEALIAPLNNTVADRARCPSKIPMYMMAGKPIITCNIGEAWEYLKDAGVYYTPEDPKSLATSFARIWSVPTQFPSMEAEVVSWESLSSRYLDFWRGAAQ